ncbi:MAG: trypsin-like peptidase domain-containing protein [Proteobacteria bacterium]|nr:trypsin-like peptidase domain-containing protein [Pseudomonadota bacterium]
MKKKHTFFSFSIFAVAILVSTSINARVLMSVADIAEQGMQGVVNIRTTQYIPNKDPQLDLYQFFMSGRIPQNQTTHAVGSGVLIDKRGHILTNNHVIEGASSIEILLSKGKQKYHAKVVGSDPKTDLALLKIEANTSLSPLEFGNSDAIRIGDVVVAVGNPFGYSHTVTSGIISAKGRVLGSGPYDNYLQTDASIHPGNSGGPLLDARGRLVGINTAVSSEGAGIGFAIPINLAKTVMKDLMAFGKAKRPWLGIIGKNILSQDDIEAGGSVLSGVSGIIVSNLIIDSPAQIAGLKIGDVIVQADQSKVIDLNQFQRHLIGKNAGSRIKLKLYRRGKGYLTTTIVLEETPKAEDLPQEKDLF